MQAESKINIQRERFAEALKSIKPDITEADRKAVINETGLTNATIISYLKGGGKNNDLSARLLMLFREKIAKREEILQSA